MSHVAKTIRHKGLTAFQIKVIALFCMTLDHLAAFGFEISVFARYSSYLRTVGRIAAPLFLFVLVQSIRHTKSKTKFLLRLYLAGMCVGLFDTAICFFTGEMFGYRTPGNIIFTFCYAALYVVLIERLISAYRCKDGRRFCANVILFLLSLLPTIFFETILGVVPNGPTMAYRFLFQGLRTSFIPSFYDVEYGIGFIILGVLLYFAKTTKKQCCTFAVYCLICFFVNIAVSLLPSVSYVSFFGSISPFYDFFQCRMVLALPFMMLYNGARGRESKWFFYWYYPLHRQLIAIISVLVT